MQSTSRPPSRSQDERIAVISKPGGTLSHPTDKVLHNTVTHLLSKQLECKVHLAHRLDLETSGSRSFPNRAERSATRPTKSCTTRSRIFSPNNLNAKYISPTVSIARRADRGHFQTGRNAQPPDRQSPAQHGHASSLQTT